MGCWWNRFRKINKRHESTVYRVMFSWLPLHTTAYSSIHSALSLYCKITESLSYLCNTTKVHHLTNITKHFFFPSFRPITQSQLHWNKTKFLNSFYLKRDGSTNAKTCHGYSFESTQIFLSGAVDQVNFCHRAETKGHRARHYHRQLLGLLPTEFFPPPPPSKSNFSIGFSQQGCTQFSSWTKWSGSNHLGFRHVDCVCTRVLRRVGGG